MTDAKKILTLLQSDDEKNRRLGFELIHSLDQHEAVRRLINQSFTFDFLESGFLFLPHHFFYHRGALGYPTTLEVFQSLDQVGFKDEVVITLKKRSVMIIADFEEIISPSTSFGDQTMMMWAIQGKAFHLLLRWIVNDVEHQLLSSELQSLRSALSSESTYRAYTKQMAETNWYGGMPEEYWGSLAHGLFGHAWHYHLTSRPDTNSECLIWIKIDEHNPR